MYQLIKKGYWYFIYTVYGAKQDNVYFLYIQIYHLNLKLLCNDFFCSGRIVDLLQENALKMQKKNAHDRGRNKIKIVKISNRKNTNFSISANKSKNVSHTRKNMKVCCKYIPNRYINIFFKW